VVEGERRLAVLAELSCLCGRGGRGVVWWLVVCVAGVLAGGVLEKGVGGEPSPSSLRSSTSPAGAGEVGGSGCGGWRFVLWGCWRVECWRRG